MLKRTIYIALFTLLGIVLSFIVHAALEIPIINLLVKDFDTYGLGFSWDTWYAIHGVIAILLFLIGAIGGYTQGVHWWQVIYVEKRYPKKFS